MLKALVFDFDGVIVDTETEWYYIYRDWLKREFAYDLQIKDYLICVGASSKSLFAFIEQELGKDIDACTFEKQMMQTFIERTKDLPAMDGVVELIREAKQKGLNIAIATSATKKKPLFHLERLQLLADIDVLSTAELSEHIKPAPDIFLMAAKLLGCTSEECLAIEDSNNGLQAAKSAGMPCLLVPNLITKDSEFEGYYQLETSLNNVILDEIIQDFNQQ